ncbi:MULTISPECIES: phosphate signaling complex protein PhoU [Nesterenkonia]|uniref:Phosphate-specific transport system accessory protein PhoU n=1 Tax=Nesterenkonia xinjiangensis TaxID=225327 RepID=A0A7Z0K836_9MICC|nr:phosphate signaling complex protein PhoU [Nesterenkonia sp. HG001]MDZ5076819.1 phosphate signaling complex protein PhoU [Nesterenkonia sp. HG001]NYJ77179.1 phosphate transport system protein [Nesterenkonia xinjiangensis]
MRKLFQEDLQNLGEQLIDISTLVSQAMQKAYRAFEAADVQLAEEVIAADQRIDSLQNDLDERAIDLLALQGPVASDLRTIVGALRMSTSLERMGDLARHIGQLVRLRYPDHVSPDHLKPVYAKMARHAQNVGEKVVVLLQTRDLALVEEIAAENAEIDALHASVFRLIAEEDWDASAATTADCTLASRYFERFGDHGVSVAKKVAYLVTGEWDVRTPAE